MSNIKSLSHHASCLLLILFFESARLTRPVGEDFDQACTKVLLWLCYFETNIHVTEVLRLGKVPVMCSTHVITGTE